MLMSKKYLVSGIIVAVGLVATSLIIPFVVFEVHKVKRTEHDPIVIWGDEDFNLYNLPGQGSKDNPFRIENYNITTESDVGINIWNTTKYFIIQNCYVNANETGIFIDSVASGTALLMKNICEMNLRHGIRVYGSDGTSLLENKSNNNGFGIYVHSSLGAALFDNECTNNDYGIIILYSPSSALAENVSSNNMLGNYIGYSASITLSQNEFTNNEYGIYIESSAGSLLADNICSNNVYGIYLESSAASQLADNELSNNEYGIYVISSSASLIEENTFKSNNFGLYLTSSSTNSCLFTNNSFQDNIEYAIYIGMSNYDNRIHHNTFLNDDETISSQAYDDGVNIWYDTETDEGNYWSDWSGIGAYAIDGVTSNVDPYPLENRPV